MEPTNVNVSCIFVLRSHAISIAKHGNGSQETAGRRQIRAQANMSPRCSYVMFPIEKQSGKTLYFLEKSVLLIFKFCPLTKLMFCFFL